MFGVGLRAGLKPLGDSEFLSSILVMNAIGAFALGAVGALALRKLISPQLRLLVGTGAIGGFTSYSALFADVWWRVTEPDWSTIVITIVTIATGPCFAYLGWQLGSAGPASVTELAESTESAAMPARQPTTEYETARDYATARPSTTRPGASSEQLEARYAHLDNTAGDTNNQNRNERLT